MGWIKKALAGVLVTAILAGAGYKGITVIQKSNEKEVMVTSVSNITNTYYESSTSLEGYITTNVSQNIHLDEDMIVNELFVEVGQSVKKGDKLVSFDMTLTEMEYNIEKLKNQKLQQDLAKAERRLQSLKNGGPIEESSSSDYSGYDNNYSGYDSNSYEDEEENVAKMSTGSINGIYVAAAMPQLLATAFTDDFSDSESAEESYEEGSYGVDSGIDFQDPTAGELSDGAEYHPDEPEVTPEATPTPQPERDPNTTFDDSGYVYDNSGISDGNPTFYQELDYNSEPFAGSGTKEDPYVFLCSSAKGYIKAKGSFFNHMAGYSEDGTKVEKEGGSWFILEFHTNDTIADFLERKSSCQGYYLIDGSLLSKAVDKYVEKTFTIEEALHYEQEEENDNGGGDNGGGGYVQPTISRQEAIKQQEMEISGLKLDIQESNLEILKYEKKLRRKESYSKLDGIIADIHTDAASTGEPYMTIKSKDGYFVKGTVSELLLDQVQEGTILLCNGYESGNFEAEVIDVSEYPVSSDNFWGQGNPNSSYYSYSALLTDPSVQVSDSDWLTVTIAGGQSGESSPLIVNKAFVKTENGNSYVYIDRNGVLKKQQVIVGEILDGGYNVKIDKGLSVNDLIAFPYGKTVKEGAITRQVSLDEMYGY